MISTIIPVYNEAENVEVVALDTLSSYRENGIEGEIIFVDNASTDGTPQVLEKVRGISPLIKVVRIERRGKSLALREGIDRAKGDELVLLEGDGQYDPMEIPRLIRPLKNFDMVSGKRIHRRDPPYRLLIPFIGHLIFNRIYGTNFRDMNSGFKAFRRDFFRKINFAPQGFYGLHRFLVLLALWNGCSVLEVDISHFPRRGGYSKTNVFFTTFQILVDYLRLIRRYRKRFGRGK